MKKLTNRLMAIAFISTILMLTNCKDDDKMPSKPQIVPELSELPLIPSATKSFSITVSAAGKIQDITASADKGDVTVTNIVGKEEATGTATIVYKAPATAGAAKITITVTDKLQQQSTKDVTANVTTAEIIQIPAGTIADGATWGPFKTYYVNGNITIPAGKSLKVMEGTTVIVNGAYAININGNFYSYGTAKNQVLFTVPEDKRKKENIFSGLWGGILATNQTTTEMAVIYTRIEYTGMPGVSGTDIVDQGEVKAGDPTYALFFNNASGKIVVLNSTFAYTVDVALQINRGSLLVANNTFILNGKSGGESVNMKPGAVGDVAFNVFYSTATNGVKWSNSSPVQGIAQNNVNVYNNTAIGCGWRQTKAGRGGSFNLEKGGSGKVYNNIVVNSKYGVKFPTAGDAPEVAKCSDGYNLYYGITDNAVAGFYPSEGIIVKNDANPLIGFETSKDISGAKGANDPLFVNFNVTTFDETAAKTSANIDYPAAFDFHLKTGSPALDKGKTGWATNNTDITVDGTKYIVPAPAAFIGAYGTAN